jgi:putative heme-binding domain-containing protein
MPAAQLKRNILKPGASIAFGFELTEVRTRDGERIAGVLEEETEQLIRLYDTSALPPPLRTIERADIRQSKTRKRSPMPADAAEAYRPQELDAIVAFLEEL